MRLNKRMTQLDSFVYALILGVENRKIVHIYELPEKDTLTFREYHDMLKDADAIKQFQAYDLIWQQDNLQLLVNRVDGDEPFACIERKVWGAWTPYLDLSYEGDIEYSEDWKCVDMTDVEYHLSAEPELDISPESELSEEDAKIVRKQIKEGNEWAWCTVCLRTSVAAVDGKVYAEYNYLGGCNYENEEDFKDNSGYYDDMKVQGLIGLVDLLKHNGYTVKGEVE